MYEAPHAGVESLLAQLWAELLHVQQIGRHDHFFALGGHSLLAMRMVSQVRQRLGLPAGAEPDRTGGLTGQIYQGIRGVTQLVGHGLDSALASLLPLVDDPANHPEPSPGREAVLAALNGVLGDRLQALGNPLAQAMELRAGGVPLSLSPGPLKAQLPGAGPHILLLIHGLCMNDQQWLRDGHDHGQALAPATGSHRWHAPCSSRPIRRRPGRAVRLAA